jgi:hypothetical protein
MTTTLYHNRIASGLCGKCGSINGTALVYCERCMKKHRERMAARYQKRKAAGVCYDCGKVPAVGGGVECLNCKKKRLTRQAG